jgi:hypothetical protein
VNERENAMTTDDRVQQRFERFAQLRAADPFADYEEIMTRIHDEEVEADEREHGLALAAQDEQRDEDEHNHNMIVAEGIRCYER